MHSETHAVRLYSACAINHGNHSNQKNPSSDSYLNSKL
jgi:hypothetical protein